MTAVGGPGSGMHDRDRRLSSSELAHEANAGAEQIEALVKHGILVPAADEPRFGGADSLRARLALACIRSGLPVEAIGGAIAEGRLSLAFLDLLYWSGGELIPSSYEELCRSRGVSPQLFTAVHDSLAFPRPQLQGPARSYAETLVSVLAVARELDVGDDVLIRAFRVYGENLRRIAQAEAAFYHNEIEGRLLESGLDENSMREVATQLSMQLVPLVERLLLSIYYRHQEHYALDDLVGHVEGALGGFRRETTPDVICFLDLTDYTRLTEERGDAAAASVVRSLASLVEQTTAVHGGRPVKWLGDGVMLHFDRPLAAVLSALEMVERAPGAGLPSAHVGIHAGPVVFQDADYYGRTVNLASRVASRAGPEQVLVTDPVRDLTDDPRAAFRPLGPVSLKGLAEPVSLHEAHRS